MEEHPAAALVTAYEELFEATDGATFRQRLAAFLRRAPEWATTFPTEWVEEVARLVECKRAETGGRPRQQKRLEKVQWLYLHLHPGQELLTRAEAIVDMQPRFKLTPENASKLYDQAAKDFATKPYAVTLRWADAPP